MKRRYFLAGGLLLVPLFLALAWWWLLHSEAGARFVFARAAAALDGGLHARELEGSIAGGISAGNVSIRAGNTEVTLASPAVTVGIELLPLSVTLTGVRAAEVDVFLQPASAEDEDFDLDESLARLKLPLLLVIEDARVGALRVYRDRDEVFAAGEIRLRGSWSDQVRVAEFEAQVDETEISASGKIALAAPRHFELQFATDFAAGLHEELPGLTLRGSMLGSPEDWRFDAEGTLQTLRAGAMPFAASGSGNLEALAVDALRVDGDALRAAGNGQVGWQGELHVDTTLVVEHAYLNTVIQNWPAEHPVAGDVSMRYAQRRLAVSPAQLSVSGTDATINAEAVLDLESGNVDSRLDWASLRWPVAGEEARIASKRGDVRVTGRIEDWQVAGSLSLEAAGLDDGRFGIEGTGNREGASVRIIEGDILGGRVAGDVAANWTGKHEWQLDLTLENVHTGAIWPQYAGTVSGTVSANGQARPLQFAAQLDNVRGEIGGYRLVAGGGLQYDDRVFAADGLLIRHGDSRIRLDGDVRRDGLQFAAETAHLEDYLPEIAGDLKAEGRLQLIDGVEALQVEASSERFVLQEQEFLGTRVELDSHDRWQQVDVRTRYSGLGLTAKLAGQLAAFEAPYDWRGYVQSLELVNEQAEALSLVEETPLALSRDAVNFESLCLDGPREGRLCGSLAWHARRELDIGATVDNVPLAHVNRFFDTGFDFDHRVSGDLQWLVPADGVSGGRADIVVSAGTIRSVAEDGLSVKTGRGHAAVEIDQGQVLNGTLELPLPGTGEVNGNFTVDSLGNRETSKLAGDFHIDVADLGFVRILLPAIDEARGKLRADVALGGTLGRPHATGSILLENGQVDYRPLGLRLRDMSVDTRFDADRQFELQGSFRAGDGEAQLSSAGDYGSLADAGFDVQIDGKNLELINVPDVRATADTDLLIGFHDGKLTIDGQLTVPHARLSADSLPEKRYSESSDVVIVQGSLPEETSEDSESPLKISGELGVTLGDDVRVELDLAEARVTGTTKFTWSEGLVPLANGRFDIAGQVQAYGQVLDITEGAVRFPRVPADNPKLRIRAEREIFGNSQVKRAGVLVDGTAQRPTVEVYTEPRTTEERALTLLVTGSDFDMEQGVGAIDFGTYIAPKLFVSYGVGLFDKENVISARYDLGKGFGVKATSGQSETGIDLIYRVEK